MADTSPIDTGKNLGRLVPAGILILFVLVLAGGLLPSLANAIATKSPVYLWVGVMIAMASFIALVGYHVNGRWPGMLIDPRYKMSLSRLQLTLWTILGLSAFLTVAAPRILGRVNPVRQVKNDDLLLNKCRDRLNNEAATAEECAGPLQVIFPPELLLAMGISTVSFAGSSLIQSTKKKKEVNIGTKDAAVSAAKQKRTTAAQALTKAEEALTTALQKKNRAQTELDAAATTGQGQKEEKTRADAAARVHEQAAADFEAARAALSKAEEDLAKVSEEFQKALTEAEGLLHKNADPSEASWIDLFRGDEIGNYRLIDVSKVQMFFFTIVVVGAYGAAFAALLSADVSVIRHPLGVELPPFDNSLNTLLGISHGGYLTVTSVDHTKAAL